jgi:3-hydroxymyristoyl/3-hydroxydecanoyl-(acyl carrier protein) dehydratase
LPVPPLPRLAVPSTSFVIPADHPCLPGHFPGRPLVPGVVMLDRVLEAIQAACPQPLPATWRLPQVKFLQPLLPGERATIELVPTASLEGAPRWRFKVLRGAEVLASGELVAGPAP